MPLNPIDLQTVFTQMSQVGRQQSAEREGALLHTNILADELKKQEDINAKTVKKLNEDTQIPKVNDEEARKRKQDTREQNKPEEETQAEVQTIHDPYLGGIIDISG
jgi:hypothetical protein